RYTCSNLEKSKKCSWSSKSQELEAVRILWCADNYIYYNTVDFDGREEISTPKLLRDCYIGPKGCGGNFRLFKKLANMSYRSWGIFVFVIMDDCFTNTPIIGMGLGDLVTASTQLLDPPITQLRVSFKLLEAVEKRFGENAATKKTQRNLLKQQFENFSAPSSEMLDQTFDRLQKNKADLDTISMDDLYKNLKMYEPEIKKMSSLNSNTQNMAFLSFTNSSTNGGVNTAQTINTANEVSTAINLWAILPLQIFEYRYRIMMHTLLQTDLRFGVIYTDASTGTADVGCVGEVVKHERLVDDRFFIICKGQERFRVTKIVRTKPYLVAEVVWLEDRPSGIGEDDLEGLASEVEGHMKDVIRLSNRLNGKPEKETGDLRRNLFPTPFSFFVGSTFEGAPREQQALLELEDTMVRLKREKETLRNTLNYLSAASAVKDVFPSSST
nr:lon protease 2-like [Tanacetum cinerariifolium]